ncbi:MAG TPA: SGNH/GDSL hydrolase family protein [Pseudonocardiaceae bacterium]|jgi:lysophospholipase L1-like esterase
MAGSRVLRTAAVVAGAVGGLSSAAYGLLMAQSERARIVIGEPESPPFNADGVYLPDGSGPHAPGVGANPLRFAVLGDSSAAGLGVDEAAQVPGVLLAKAMAEEAGRAVLLTTYAISGATTPDLAGQVDLALAQPPEVALVIVGANDVSELLSIRESARLLGVQLSRLREGGAAVVMGTCPNLGTIRPIPQPLRRLTGMWSLLLAGAQRRAVLRAECTPVVLAELLSPEFFARPDDLFSADRFHPNAAGYEAAAAILLAPLCVAAGVWTPRPESLAQPIPLRRSLPAVGRTSLAAG